jgi:hypothetical protein
MISAIASWALVLLIVPGWVVPLQVVFVV